MKTMLLAVVQSKQQAKQPGRKTAMAKAEGTPMRAGAM